MIDLPPVTWADVLAREAGPPHVWTHEDAMELGMETGWRIEPVVEAEDTAICPAQWHVRDDWHRYCNRTLPEDPKRPTFPLPAETWARLGWPVAPAMSGWGYAPAWRGDGGSYAATRAGGGGFVWGWGDSTEDGEAVTVTLPGRDREFREIVRTDTHSVEPPIIVRVPCCGGACLWCPVPQETQEPAPVPLPASGWMLGLLAAAGIGRGRPAFSARSGR